MKGERMTQSALQGQLGERWEGMGREGEKRAGVHLGTENIQSSIHP